MQFCWFLQELLYIHLFRDKNGLHDVNSILLTTIMPITFHQKRDEFGDYWTARIESPYGAVYNVDPFSPLECSISHQTKGGKHGFGVKFSAGKNCKVLQVGTVGEAEDFLGNIKRELSPRWFWKQDEEETY